MPNVQYIRSEVAKMQPIWRMIKDTLAGQDAIKKGRVLYLPMPNSSDQSEENLARYDDYVERAVFYNVTQRTHGGLVGQVFRRSPVVEIPNDIISLISDVDGCGVGLDQQAKKALGEVLAYGRCGLFVDYPVSGGISKAQLDAGYIHPTIDLYEPWEIINWRTRQVGSRCLLSLVVLRESYVAEDDGFEVKMKDQWRVLRLDETNTYHVDIYTKGSDGQPLKISFTPRDAKGKPLNEIPFIFCGSVNNDENIDLPPLYDMAVLNIAHYRNSADYEESCFISGQPTPYFSGLTREWVDDVWKSKKVMLGSRAAVTLPEKGTAGMLQAESNTMPFEAMTQKEKQMISLGAKLVEQSTVQRTATEARQEEASESSILSACATNISAAYTQALKYCQIYTGGTDSVKYVLNTEFELSKLSATEIQQVIASWNGAAITFEEMRNLLRKAGYTSVDDAKAKTAIMEEGTLRQAVQQQQTVKQTTTETKV